MDRQTDTMCPLSYVQTEMLFGDDWQYWDEVRRCQAFSARHVSVDSPVAVRVLRRRHRI